MKKLLNAIVGIIVIVGILFGTLFLLNQLGETRLPPLILGDMSLTPTNLFSGAMLGLFSIVMILYLVCVLTIFIMIGFYLLKGTYSFALIVGDLITSSALEKRNKIRSNNAASKILIRNK